MSGAEAGDSDVLTVEFEFVPDNGQPAPPAPWQPMVIDFSGGGGPSGRWCGYFKSTETTPPQKQL